MKPRVFTALAGVAVAGLALSACASGDNNGDGGGGGNGGDPVTLTFLAPEYSGVTKGYWEDLIADFHASQDDYRIELESIDWGALDQRVNTLIGSGSEPDILNHSGFAHYAEDGLLLPVEDYLPSGVYSDLLPSFLEVNTYEGTEYAIPFIASARALFYNKELLKEAGVEPPTNWEEVANAAQQVKEKTGKIGYGLPLGPLEASVEFAIWAWNNGGDVINDQGEWVINSSQNAETMTYLKDLYDRGLTQESPGTSDRDDLFRMFGEGEIGMLQGAAFLPAVMEQQGSTVDYGVIQSPANGNNPPATLAVQDLLMVFESTKSPEGAGAFLEFFYQPENYVKFLQNEGMLPATASGADAMKDDPVASQFTELLTTSRFLPASNPEWGAVQQELKAKIGQAISGSNPQAVLDEIQQVAERK